MFELLFHRLENVGDELVTPVVTTGSRVVVVPLLVVNRNSHFGRVAMVQTVGTPVILVAPVVLWIRDVRVVIKTVHVLRTLLPPIGAVGRLLSLCG